MFEVLFCRDIRHPCSTVAAFAGTKLAGITDRAMFEVLFCRDIRHPCSTVAAFAGTSSSE